MENHSPVTPLPERDSSGKPAARRVLGLDVALIGPTLAILLVVLFFHAFLPAVDAAVKKREVEPGTVYDIGPVHFTPAPGWVLVQPPSPVGTSTSAAVYQQDMTFLVKGGNWSGTAEELLNRVADQQKEFAVEGKTYKVATSEGSPGVAKKIVGPDYVGLLATFVDAHRGVEVVAKGPATASPDLAIPIARMVQSIQFEPVE